jgi:FAD/FMN-containing dehydrogenase
MGYLIATAAALLSLSGSASALSLAKRAAVEDCFTQAGVPFHLAGSSGWTQDSAPFNLRLNYTPIAIAVPTTVKHIQDAVTCGQKMGLKANPKSGGHSYASFGLGGEDGHLTIELDRMNKVTLDNATGIATVEGGARLGHVAAELYAQGKRDFSHGTCPG